MTDSLKPLYGEVSPWLAVVISLLLGFVGVMLIRIVVEQDFYLLRWKAFVIGDSIAFSLYAFFASRGLQDYYPKGRWYDQRWLVLALMVLGVLIGIYLLRDAMQNRQVSLEEATLPSELFHTFITYPALMALIVRSAIILFFVSDASRVDKLGAAAGLLIYGGAFLYDSSPLQDRGPGR